MVRPLDCLLIGEAKIEWESKAMEEQKRSMAKIDEQWA